MKRTIKEVYDLIKEKRDNAERDYKRSYEEHDYIRCNNLDYTAMAYKDVLCLIESSHLLEEDKPVKGSGLEALERIGKEDLHSEREDYCFLKNVYVNEYNIIEKSLKALEFIKEEIEFGFEIVNNQTRLTLTARGVKVMSITINKEKYNLLKEELL